MRLMFYRPASATFPSGTSLPYQVSLPVSSSSGPEAFVQAFNLVGNPGNMVHRMAMVQSLKFDRDRSAALNVIRMSKDIGPKDTAKNINENFDAAVFTFSNIVNPEAEEPGLADIIGEVNIPIYALGIGIQKSIPPMLSSLSPSVEKLLRTLDEKAKVFGVRGDITKAWLNEAGLKKPQSLGCPSMFVYPHKIYNLKPPTSIDRVMTAGHMGAINLRDNGNQRGRKLIAGFTFEGQSPLELSYVFQGEVRNYPSFKKTPFIYDESTSTLNFEAISEDISRTSGLTSPFSRFYSFNDVTAWRQACMRYQVFIGDRIHGAVAAMQAGTPALVLHSDVRVQELTTHHGIPNCSLEEFSQIGYRAAVEKYLTEEAFQKFQGRYVLAMKNFSETLTQAGMEFANSRETGFVLKDLRDRRANKK